MPKANGNKNHYSPKPGWTVDRMHGSSYRFEHILLSKADDMLEAADKIHVVETINGTIVKDSSPTQVHRNMYFGRNLEQAIGKAVQLIMDLRDVAETVIAIRVATPREEKLFWKAFTHFYTDEAMPDTLTDDVEP